MSKTTKPVASVGAGSARASNATDPRNQRTTVCQLVVVPLTNGMFPALVSLFIVVLEGGGDVIPPTGACAIIYCVACLNGLKANVWKKAPTFG